MNEKLIDARGLSCPEPIMRTKKGLEEITKGTIRVLVDSPVAKENIINYIHSLGLEGKVEEEGDCYTIITEKS